MESILDLLQEPIVESIGGTGIAILIYRLVLVFLATYGKREDTEQAQASADQTEAEASLAKEETTQKLIGVLGDVAATNTGLTDGLGILREAITAQMDQSHKTEEAVNTQGTKIAGLEKTIGRATTAMTDHTEKVAQVGQGIIAKLEEQTTSEQYEEILRLLRELKEEVVTANAVTTGLVDRVSVVESTVEVWADKVKRETQEAPAVKAEDAQPPTDDPAKEVIEKPITQEKTDD